MKSSNFQQPQPTEGRPDDLFLYLCVGKDYIGMLHVHFWRSLLWFIRRHLFVCHVCIKCRAKSFQDEDKIRFLWTDPITATVNFNAQIYFMRFFMRRKENLAENPMFMLSQWKGYWGSHLYHQLYKRTGTFHVSTRICFYGSDNTTNVPFLRNKAHDVCFSKAHEGKQTFSNPFKIFSANGRETLKRE